MKIAFIKPNIGRLEHSLYVDEGRSYLVSELDLTQNLAYLQPAEVDYYTQPRRESEVSLVEVYARQAITGGEKAYGELNILSQVTGYHKIEWNTHQRLGTGLLDMPQNEFQTTGYWLMLGEEVIEVLRQGQQWNSDPNDYGPNWEIKRNAARDRDGYAVDFFRRPVRVAGGASQLRGGEVLRHVGLYGFRRTYLLKLAALEPSGRERELSLEQLRPMEHGCRIRVVETDYRIVGVDRPEDIEKAERLLIAESERLKQTEKEARP